MARHGTTSPIRARSFRTRIDVDYPKRFNVDYPQELLTIQRDSNPERFHGDFGPVIKIAGPKKSGTNGFIFFLVKFDSNLYHTSNF